MNPLRRLGSSASARFDWMRFGRTLAVASRDHLERLGSEYGGYVIPVDLPRPDWLCYSCGVGEDTSFDLALIERFGCTVFAFDPTPRAAEHGAEIARRNERFRFLPYGVAGQDEQRRFYAPRDQAHVSHSISNVQKSVDYFIADCRTLQSLMRDLGHDRIDLLKLDVEGAEYEVLEPLLEGVVETKLLCVEFHKVDSMHQMVQTVRRLADRGYYALHHHRLVTTFIASAERT